jgi:UDP-glucuronate decarboxylase
MKKNVIVAGGAGFIGRHLCKRLLAKNYNVICLDNLYTGSLDNVREFLGHPNFHMREHDIVVPYHVASADFIYNLACPASPVHYQRSPTETLRTAVFGTRNMLECARRSGAVMLQASTSEVYGDPLEHPQRETYFGNVNPIGPRACYDEGKRCAEAFMFSYRSEFEQPIKVVRIFNTYGPYMQVNDGRVVSNFIVQALKGESITIYGDGSQTRSFCYVDDLVEGMIQFVETTSRNVAGPINLGNPGEFTVAQLAELVIDLTGSSSKVTRRPLPADDPKLRRPDISLARKLLDWSPKVELVTGLKRTIDYFDDLLSQGEMVDPSMIPLTGATAPFLPAAE